MDIVQTSLLSTINRRPSKPHSEQGVRPPEHLREHRRKWTEMSVFLFNARPIAKPLRGGVSRALAQVAQASHFEFLMANSSLVSAQHGSANLTMQNRCRVGTLRDPATATADISSRLLPTAVNTPHLSAIHLAPPVGRAAESARWDTIRHSEEPREKMSRKIGGNL